MGIDILHLKSRQDNCLLKPVIFKRTKHNLEISFAPVLILWVIYLGCAVNQKRIRHWEGEIV